MLINPAKQHPPTKILLNCKHYHREVFPKEKRLEWLELRKLTSDWVGFVADYVDFIMSIRSDLKNTKMVNELKIFENKIANATGPFLTYEQTLRKQNKIFPFILEWNPDIEDQVSDFYNATVEMARLSAKSEKFRSQYNPFKLLKENEERFYLAKEVIDKIQNSVNIFKPTVIEVYAMFYGIIATTETVYHFVFKQFKESLRFHRLDRKYDARSIFSVSTDYTGRKDEIQSSLRSLRNSIAHFNFRLQEAEGGKLMLVLDLQSAKNKPQQITFDEFKWIYFNSIFLLQSILAIQYWMAAFATIRGNFIKKQKCPKCKSGHLIISATREIYETRDSPKLHMFWICDKCNKKFSYDRKKLLK